MDTVWILGDQLRRDTGALTGKRPGEVRVLMVESDGKIGSGRWHRQRLHFVLASMRRFAEELKAEGFAVDYRHASSMRAGFMAHKAEFKPAQITAMSPMSFDGLAMLQSLNVDVIANDQFLCSAETFAQWAGDHRRYCAPCT